LKWSCFFGNCLDLLKAVDGDDEDGGALGALGGGGAGLVQDFDGGIDLLGLEANEQGGHAATQKAPGGSDARDAEIGGGEALGDGVGIGIADYGKDEFHG